MLYELEREAGLAVALWQGLRDVGVLARIPREAWERVFAPPPADARAGSADLAAPELRGVLSAFEALARAPRDFTPEGLSELCRTVYAWAEERALLQTAAHFAEAAALVQPNAPNLANLAARTCRRAARHDRAGLWYQRGRALGVQSRRYFEIFSATMGYGFLMYTLGRFDTAYKYMSKAGRRARNRGHLRMAAEAAHGILTICSEVRSREEGEEHALHALRQYPVHDKRVPLLVHDAAYFLVSCGIYTPAVSVLLETVKLVRPQEAVLVWSTAARAAAGAGRLDAYHSSAREALLLAERYPEAAPAALRNVAYAAQMAKDWARAEACASRAAEMARQRRMSAVEQTSRELLAQVRIHMPGAPETEPPADSRAAEIARLCHVRLRKWMGPKVGRPPGTTPPV